METPTPRRLVFRPRPLTLILGGVLALLVAIGAWTWSHQTRLPQPESPQDRMARQIRDQAGAGAELRYAEAGHGYLP